MLLYAPGAMALKRAIFPDSSALQPMPTNVHSNISGNVNSKVGQPKSGQNMSGSNSKNTGLKNNIQTTIVSNKSPWGFVAVSAFFVVIIFSIVFILYLRKYKKRFEK